MFVMYGLLVAIGVVVVGLVLSSCRCFTSGRSLCHYWEPGLKSYAIGRMDKPTHLFLGSLQYPAGEVSDIPKHDDPNQ